MKIVPAASSLMIALIAFPPVGVGAAGCFEGAEYFHPDDWAYCQEVTEDIFMYYTPFVEEGNLMLGLHAAKDAPGWSALAIGGNGGMKGAAQIVVRKNEDDEWIVEDRYSEAYTTPSLDETQDIKLLFAAQDDDQTSWGVLMPLNPCDEPYNYPIEDKTIYMHYALGSSHTFSFHGDKRKQFHANLMNAPKQLPSTEGVDYVDMLMPNVAVELGPGGEDPSNPYICSFFDMMVISDGKFGTDAPVHAIRFSPVLAEESKQYVHHMILYACSDEEEGQETREHLQVVPQCDAMPEGCYQIKFPWAVGAGDVVFPEDVGMPVENRWLVLQMHYYNPALAQGVMDNSGVRAYLTEDLREQEAGFMVFNSATGDWHADPLPAGDPNYSLRPLTVPGECTESAWASPINILGVVHHMHVLGKRMEFIVEREGADLGLMREEHYYDFKHQSLEEARPQLRSLFPGDKITVKCFYDTSASADEVSFGTLTQQEMCWGALLYYPRQNGSEEEFGYVKPDANSTACLSPAFNEDFAAANLSLCAENFFSNVPKFFDFEDLVDAPFDALTACNGGELFAELLDAIPYLCPPCHASNDCTIEEVLQQAQGYCVETCKLINVTTYPDLSDTVAYNAGTYGCSEEVSFFTTPPLAEPSMCERIGNLSQVIDLKMVDLEQIDELEVDADSETVEDLGESEVEEKPSDSTASAGSESRILGALTVIFGVVAMIS